MKKIALFLTLIPFSSSFAASFYRINQVGPNVTILETYPALGLVMVAEDDGFPNQIHTVFSVPWGLDRINQRNLPLDGQYGLLGNSNVTAFVVDTGIQPHAEFSQNLQPGYDATNMGNTGDCMGHGTHVAGTIGSASYGVAYGTKLVPVKVFQGCDGSTTTQIILRGLNYVAQYQGRPAVVNMSLGGPIDQALDDATKVIVTKGIHVVVAAGNSTADACTSSPARLGKSSAVITVGSTARDDSISSFSNYGSCVNVYAPGSDIESVSYRDGGLAYMSGTSMASPHAAGAVALYLAKNPNSTPAQTKQYLTNNATSNKLRWFGYPVSWKLLFVN